MEGGAFKGVAPAGAFPRLVEAMLDLSEETVPIVNPEDFNPLTSADKNRLYAPWDNSVIIKLLGQKMGHQLLKQKLLNLWRPSEDITLVDLGSDFSLIKSQKQENFDHVCMHDGPWFVMNRFVSIRRWEPKFVASQALVTYTAIWVHLPELPSEFYNPDILQKEGLKIGTLLKVDPCTSASSREKYARICVQVPMEQPLKTHVFIGLHKQPIIYGGFDLLCTNCGCLGHPTRACSYSSQFTEGVSDMHSVQPLNSDVT
ncbi:uncharacterized protein LOC132630947 [Lycium barbarum]|uniref:uncharacterized protein LOC132630947 n=1 Tax=Lycium barbarum TaxID=112863 RepID=UPI00293EA477|nr:uncharacterized protein LOC132630947 [Lycium barbarum]